MAPRANASVFALLLKHPLQVYHDQPYPKCIAEFGRSLLAHPDALDVLLSAQPNSREPWSANTAQAVIAMAGAPLLPRLHEALASDDRVVRSNAARACGLIGGAASVPVLIKALKLESGLARASIVWALGRLKAAEALPDLATLYIDAINDEHGRGGSGYRASQFQAEASAQYERLHNIDSISSQWDEVKRSTEPKALRPAEDEELLTPQGVLEAVRQIGPEKSQEFYRVIAASYDAGTRQMAALALGSGGADNVAKNLPVVKTLLADPEVRVRSAAAASCLNLGYDDSARPVVLALLNSANEHDLRMTLQQLTNVKDRAQLQFIRAKLEAIAANEGMSIDIVEAAQKLLVAKP